MEKLNEVNMINRLNKVNNESYLRTILIATLITAFLAIIISAAMGSAHAATIDIDNWTEDDVENLFKGVETQGKNLTDGDTVDFKTSTKHTYNNIQIKTNKSVNIKGNGVKFLGTANNANTAIYAENVNYLNISGISMEKYRVGISLNNSAYCTIFNNTFKNVSGVYPYGHIEILNSPNCNISNNTFNPPTTGVMIKVNKSSNSYISNNHYTYPSWNFKVDLAQGIIIFNSPSSTIFNNTILNMSCNSAPCTAIALINSSNSNVTYNTVNGSYTGVYLINSSFCKIDNNNISKCVGAGISFMVGATFSSMGSYSGESLNNTITNNNISQSRYGVELNQNGYTLLTCAYNNISNNLFYRCYKINDTTGEEYYTSSDTYSILFAYMANNNIAYNNTIIDSYYGLSIRDGSSNNTVDNNKFYGNLYGVQVITNCNYNKITNNKINDSKNNAIRFRNNCNYNIIAYNNITFSSLTYSIDSSGIDIDGPATPCIGNIIKFNNISNTTQGIRIYNSNNTEVFNNTIKDSGNNGIRMEHSNNTQIYNNTIAHAGYTPFSGNEFRNGIYNNNGINNTITNNTIYDNYYNGINSTGNNNTIYNNTIYGNGANGINTTGTNVIIVKNKVYTNKIGIYNDGVGNISENDVHDNTHGIYLLTTLNSFNNNNIYVNSGSGVVFQFSNGVLNNVFNNTIRRNGIGINISGDNNEIGRDNYPNLYNEVTDNGNGVLINGTDNTVSGLNVYKNDNSGFILNLGSINNKILSCNIVENKIGINCSSNGNTFNYNRIYKNSQIGLLNNGTNNNANLNWWGYNSVTDQYNDIAGDLTLKNYFVIQLTANTYKTIKTGERVNFTAGTLVTYTGTLVLNDSSVAYDKTKLPPFNVTWTNIYNSTISGDIRVINLTGSVTGNHNDLFKISGLSDSALVNLELYFESPLANNTKIEIRNFTGEVGKTVKLNATLKDGLGKIIANKMLDFYIYINHTWKYIGSEKTNAEGIAFINYTPEYTGTFLIQSNFTGDSKYKPSTNSSYLIVEPKPTKIEINDFVGEVGKTVRLNATLKDQKGNVLAGKNLTFSIYRNGAWQVIDTVRTNSNGIAYVDYTSNVDGKFPIRATFDGDALYYASTNSSTLTIVLNPTKTEINDFIGDIGKTVRLNATLKDKNGDILAGKTLTFYIRINGEWERIGSKKTNANGIAFINYVPTKAGLFPVRANFSGDSAYGASSNSSYLTVIDSSLEPTKIQQRNFATLVNTPILLSGILVDKNGEPLGDKDLLFYIQDKNGNWKYIGSSKTFESGRAVLVYTPNETGKFNIRTAFTGDSVYGASTNTSILTVVGPNSPKITHIDQYDFSGRLYKLMTLNSTLKDKNAKPLAGKPVKFYIDHGAGWIYLGEAITDAYGRAFLNYEPTQMGVFPVMTTFDGDTDYIGSANITFLTVKTNTTPPTNDTNDTNDTNKTNKTNNTHGNHNLYDDSSINGVNDGSNLNANGASMKATGLPINLLILVIFSIIGISYRKRRES